MTPEDRAWARRWRREGMPADEIAEALDVSVCDLPKRIPALSRKPRGLTGQQANRRRDAAVRKLRAEGWTLNALAARYGLTKQRVSMIVAVPAAC